MAKSIAWGHTHLPAQLGIQSGVTDVFRVEASAYVDHSVEFDAPFPVVPTVVVGLYSTSTAPQIGGIAVALMAADENGFTARVFNSGSSARLPQFGWIAVGFEKLRSAATNAAAAICGLALCGEAICGEE